MKRNDYRRAVSQVRWTDEKRRRIEAKLKALPQGKPIDDDDDDEAEGFVEVFRMDRKQLRARQREIEREERRSRIMGRIGLVVTAAGFVAAVGLFGTFVSRTKQEKPDVKFGEMGSSYGLNLTDDTADRHPTRSFVETPDGFFDLSYRDDADSSANGLVLYYTDNISGERKPVCVQKNCDHSGSLDCTASSAAYSVYRRGGDADRSDTISYTYVNGSLYTVATKWDDPASAHEKDEYGNAPLGTQVLLRCAADGSALEELHAFGTGCGDYQPVYHRGYLWFPVQLITEGDMTEDSDTHKQHRFRSGGYEIWGYELATGTLTKIYSAMTNPEQDYVNLAPHDLAGIGDYLYFNCDDRNIVSGTRRINLLTGEIGSGMDISLSSGWTTEYGLTYAENAGWYRVDLHTGEQTLLGRFRSDTVPHLTDGYIIGETVSALGDAAVGVPAGSLRKLELCDTDGQRIREIPLPDIPVMDSGGKAQMHLADISDGRVYVRLTVSGGAPGTDMDVIFCCAIDEISQNNGVWTAVIDKTQN